MRAMRRWLEMLLLVAGVLALDVWIWSHAATTIYQKWQSWVFDRKAASTASPAPRTAHRSTRVPKTAPENSVIGRLSISRLHVSAMVREGTGDKTLELALGHIPGTALPGQEGNVGVAGHRDTLFRALRKIRKNDVIVFETLAGRYAYRVESTSIVRPRNVSVLSSGRYPELTLVTCYPFYYVGSAPDRFIVKARQVQLAAGAPPPDSTS